MQFEQRGSTTPTSEALRGLKVLLIEDMLDARALFSRMIRRAGGEVEAAASAEEAWQLLPGYDPDVIVSDIGLPDEDGCAFMRRFREHEESRGTHTPAVAVTAFTHYFDRVRQAGFDGYLSKPTTRSALIESIIDAMAASAAYVRS